NYNSRSNPIADSGYELSTFATNSRHIAVSHSANPSVRTPGGRRDASTGDDTEEPLCLRNKTNGSGPGLVLVMPYIDQYCIIDCRMICYDIPAQKVLNKDSLTIDVDAVVLYRVHNSIVAVTNVRNYRRATELLAATTVRNLLGTKTLTQILAECSLINDALRHYKVTTFHNTIALSLQQHLDAATEFWGVCVERIDIKNVKIPADMQFPLSAEAQATREAIAKYVAADGEKGASMALKEAAENLDPMSIQLRFLQTLNNISLKNNSTYVVPIPTELFQLGNYNSRSNLIPDSSYELFTFATNSGHIAVSHSANPSVRTPGGRRDASTGDDTEGPLCSSFNGWHYTAPPLHPLHPCTPKSW
ncbi:unnamed protein product, partial [Medioppia subpectinata]